MYKCLNPSMVNLKPEFSAVARLAGEYGFGALEFDPLAAISERGLSAVQDTMGQYGVIIASFGLPVEVQSTQMAFEDSFASLEAYCKAAQSLGIHRSCTWIMSWSDELPFADNFKRYKERLSAVAKVYNDYGIRLGLEFLGPKALYHGKKHEFIHTLDGMLALCSDIGTGNVGIMLDAYHCYTAGMDMSLSGAFENETQIITVHINDAPRDVPIDKLPDSPRLLPGEGAIDLPAFLGALSGLGYAGPVICEPFSEKLKALSDSDEIMQLLAASVEDVWPNK